MKEPHRKSMLDAAAVVVCTLMAMYGILTIGAPGPIVLKAFGTLAATLTATMVGRRHLTTASREPTAANILGILLGFCWLAASIAQPHVGTMRTPFALGAMGLLLGATLACLPLGAAVSILGLKAGRKKRKKP